MRYRFVGFLLTATLVVPASAGELDERVAESRAVVDRIVEELKVMREETTRERGPGATVEVCSSRAPEILERYGAEKGWTIKRTSLRLRNPENAPDDWEAATLRAFKERNADGALLPGMERYEVATQDGERVFRYMQAIPMGGFCTNCHGPTLAQGVEPVLEELYPEDKATGFAVGELRGGYSIVQPVD